ncbi:MAG: alpha/beta hydrolase [Armatimonadetes bacterium]|nr:alpha/beta hydrolase [Armatimonadota bacterium]
MPEALVNGLRISYEISGEEAGTSPTAVIYIHGSGGTGYVWKNQLRVRVPGFCQVTVDLPGHGRSAGAGARTIEEYSSFIRDFARAVFGAPVVLAGHSMGGAVAMSFALVYPEYLKGLILAGTGARLRVAPAVLEAVQDPEKSAALRGYAYSPKTSPAVVEEAEKEADLTPAQVRYNDFLACDRFDIMDRVKEIRVPTLVVCGEDDVLTPVKYSRYLEANIPGARLAVIPAAGHMVMREQPEEVNKAIAEFLATL